jgi:hypothetical protein
VVGEGSRKQQSELRVFISNASLFMQLKINNLIQGHGILRESNEVQQCFDRSGGKAIEGFLTMYLSKTPAPAAPKILFETGVSTFP